MVRKKMNVEAQQELTKAELELMQVIWDKEKVLVHDILDVLPEPKPAYNTVSTIVRILEQKGFVGHKAYGRTYEYFPLVSKEAYTQRYMTTVLDNFFDGSLSRLVSFMTVSAAAGSAGAWAAAPLVLLPCSATVLTLPYASIITCFCAGDFSAQQLSTASVSFQSLFTCPSSL